jgi:hypothetical protein
MFHAAAGRVAVPAPIPVMGRNSHAASGRIHPFFKNNTLFFKLKYMIKRIEQNLIIHIIGPNKKMEVKGHGKGKQDPVSV